MTIGGIVAQSAQNFAAIVDTGFTGFVAMPLIKAFPLGLVLAGTTNIVLADGSTRPRLTAYGDAILDKTMKPGVVILDPTSDDVLLGMDFLRKFEATLTVDLINKTVYLDG